MVCSAQYKKWDVHGHVIYTKSFSKTLAPGCRVSILAAFGRILERLFSAKSQADLGSPLLTQRIVAQFVASAAMEKHLKHLCQALERRKRICTGVLDKMVPTEVKWTDPGGGLNLWLSLPKWMNVEDLLFAAIKRKIDFLSGISFMLVNYPPLKW
jgi:DNA-binding transcriptional MocR family regulator